jgi:hypothetical protein
MRGEHMAMVVMSAVIGGLTAVLAMYTMYIVSRPGTPVTWERSDKPLVLDFAGHKVDDVPVPQCPKVSSNGWCWGDEVRKLEFPLSGIRIYKMPDNTTWQLWSDGTWIHREAPYEEKPGWRQETYK